AARRQHVKKGIDHLPELGGARPPQLPDRRQLGFDQCPFLIGDVTCIAQIFPAILPSSGFSPHLVLLSCLVTRRIHKLLKSLNSFWVSLLDNTGRNRCSRRRSKPQRCRPASAPVLSAASMALTSIFSRRAMPRRTGRWCCCCTAFPRSPIPGARSCRRWPRPGFTRAHPTRAAMAAPPAGAPISIPICGRGAPPTPCPPHL